MGNANPEVKEISDYVTDDVDDDGIWNALKKFEEEQEFMEKVMPNSLSSRWTPLFADVNPKGLSKKVGIDIFCKHFGVELEETMAFGDGGNDISMLKHVK
ncbi:UNVERIFIED_CONTAM: hypothetical protein NCL1_51096, partial [Trichonephila clavipes]